MNTKKLFKILGSTLPLLAVFLASLFPPADPDLGWYLKYGQHFFQHKSILRENTFSLEMADFKWVNHSYLTDLISYLTFENFGFLGLTVLGAAVITTTFYFFAKAAKLDYFEKALIFPPLLYFLSPLNSISFRGQLLSLMLLGILSYILSRNQTAPLVHSRVESNSTRQNDKTLYLLPPLFLLWSNLHGQFILGLAIFAIYIAAKLVSDLMLNGILLYKQALKNAFLPTIILLASILTALINPFGVGVYLEALKHFGNPLEKYISEWVPFAILTIPWLAQVLIGIAAFFGLIFMIFSTQFKEKIPQISIASVLYLISFSVRRFVWPMYYLAIPLIAPLAAYFKPENKRYTQLTATVIFVVYLVITFIVANPIKRIQNMSWQSYCQKYVFCSNEAINYLTSNPPAGGLTSNLLTYYGWGGYMIWNHPQIKPSIDGRMTLWRDDSGYSAFEVYYDFEQNLRDINGSPYEVVLMSPEKPVYNRLQELVNQGKWQKPYEDQFAGVFVRSSQ